MVGKGSQYAGAFVDSKSNPLDGNKTYKLHLPPNIPVKDFWSLIVYDSQTRSQLQTDQRFPMVSSQTKGLAINGDKSVDVYFGPKAPTGKEFTPAKLVETARGLAAGWEYEAISIGYPGMVGAHGPRSEPGNLGPGYLERVNSREYRDPWRLLRGPELILSEYSTPIQG